MWQSDWDYECQNPRLRRLRCSVWEVSVTSQSKPGRKNGIWKIVISKIWIELMESRWSSSGKHFQVSLHWAFSKRCKKLWLNYSVNLSISKEGSSSCQCTTTLYGENEETQKNVRRILADSRSDVGHVWDLDQRRNGTELILINQMENGTRLLNEWCSTLQKAVILSFVPWKEEN